MSEHLYADDFAITRGSQLPAFSYDYLTTPAALGAHKLLSATLSDALPADVVAGDIVYGNSTPKWARLAKGADGQLLFLGSGLPVWGLTPSAGFLLYAASATAWAVLAAGTNGYVLTLSDGLSVWAALTGGLSGLGTQYYLAEWTGGTSLGNSGSIFRDTGITGNPYRATLSRWRFEVMPIQLFNSSSLVPLPAPSLYWTNLYRREATDVATQGRLMQMTADGEERTLVSHVPGGHDKQSAVFFREESDGHNPSSSLVAEPSLTHDPLTGKVNYNGAELNGTFRKGSGSVTFSNTPRSADISTGLVSVTGAVCIFDYDMGDGVSVMVRPNVPSAGKIRIWGRNVTGTGSLSLTVYWIAW